MVWLLCKFVVSSASPLAFVVLHLRMSATPSSSVRNLLAGGATNFLSDGSDLPTASVVPVPGRVLLFEHRLLHEGEEVSAGVKYVVRSDIMFRRCRDQQRWAGAPSGADWVPGAASASASSAASASASTSDSTGEPRTP